MRLGAVIGLMAAARALARWRLLRVPAAWVGRRTLSIYVLHWPIIGLLGLACVASAEPLAQWLASDLIVVWSSLVVAAVIAATALAVETITKRAGLTFLFEPPRALRRRVTGVTAPAVASRA
jgi:fucose 4-O-acetylase-like acetyltransferase